MQSELSLLLLSLSVSLFISIERVRDPQAHSCRRVLHPVTRLCFLVHADAVRLQQVLWAAREVRGAEEVSL